MFKVLYKEWLSNQATDSMPKNGVFYLFTVGAQNGQQETGVLRCQPLTLPPGWGLMAAQRGPVAVPAKPCPCI